MDKNKEKRISKSISYWLRHHPDDIGITIGDDGWTDIDVLIERAADKGVEFTFEELKVVVENSDKKRFSINEDETLIRANQVTLLILKLNLMKWFHHKFFITELQLELSM